MPYLRVMDWRNNLDSYQEFREDTEGGPKTEACVEVWPPESSGMQNFRTGWTGVRNALLVYNHERKASASEWGGTYENVRLIVNVGRTRNLELHGDIVVVEKL